MVILVQQGEVTSEAVICIQAGQLTQGQEEPPDLYRLLYYTLVVTDNFDSLLKGTER